MQVTTTPCCRVGWEGATLNYTVKAVGATEISAPANNMKAAEVRVAKTNATADGVEGQLQVKVLSSEPY